jgi:hypothetical protein
MLIPNIGDLAFVNISSISWILVIEKEAGDFPSNTSQ